MYFTGTLMIKTSLYWWHYTTTNYGPQGVKMKENLPHFVPNSTKRAVWLVDPFDRLRQATEVEGIIFLIVVFNPTCWFAPDWYHTGPTRCRNWRSVEGNGPAMREKHSISTRCPKVFSTVENSTRRDLRLFADTSVCRQCALRHKEPYNAGFSSLFLSLSLSLSFSPSPLPSLFLSLSL